MSLDFVLYIAAGAAFAGFVNGLAGFGTSLFALGWWLQVLDPTDAVAVSLVISVLTGVQGVWIVRHAIEPRRLGLYLIPAFVGIPIGLSLLDRIQAEPLKLLIACFLLGYGAFFAFRRNLPTVERETPVADALLGFTGGLLGALAGLSGALPTVWLSLRDWPKAKTRAILQPFNTLVLGIAAVLLAIKGAYDSNVLFALLIATPVSLASAQVGIMVFRRINDAAFRRLLIVLMLVSGMVLLWRSQF
ncbi:MAG: sulfite exporter TauE/SafE family protein [Alphaproteobacteria bacterium]